MALTRTASGVIWTDNFPGSSVDSAYVDVGSGSYSVASNELTESNTGGGGRALDYFVPSGVRDIMFQVDVWFSQTGRWPDMQARYHASNGDLHQWFIRASDSTPGQRTWLRELQGNSELAATGFDTAFSASTWYPLEGIKRPGLQRYSTTGRNLQLTRTTYDSTDVVFMRMGFAASSYAGTSKRRRYGLYNRGGLIRVEGLESGQKARVFNSSNALIAEATESAGVAVIDPSRYLGAPESCPIPTTKGNLTTGGWDRIVVTDSSNNVLETYDTTGVYPGDIFEVTDGANNGDLNGSLQPLTGVFTGVVLATEPTLYIEIPLIDLPSGPTAVTDLKFAVWDKATPNLIDSAPIVTGVNGTITDAGVFRLDLTGMGVAVGDTVYLVATDSDGTTANTRAIAAPVVLVEGSTLE